MLSTSGQQSARFNLVALEMSKICIIGWAPRIASAWWRSLVALSNLMTVLVIRIASAPKPKCHLDTSSTDLYAWCIRILSKVPSQFTTLIKGTLSNTSTKDVLILDLHLLIYIQVCRGIGIHIRINVQFLGNSQLP